MRAHFGLPSVESDELEGKRPITVKFEIPYFTVSGIQVRIKKKKTHTRSPYKSFCHNTVLHHICLLCLFFNHFGELILKKVSVLL